MSDEKEKDDGIKEWEEMQAMVDEAEQKYEARKEQLTAEGKGGCAVAAVFVLFIFVFVGTIC